MKNRQKWVSGLAKGLTFSALTPMILTSSMNVLAADASPEIDAKAAMSIDFESGKILLNQNGDEQLGIASMTKMLVEYILFESIEKGTISWDQEIMVSDYAYGVSQNYILSNVPLRKGESYTVREMYEALAIYSANGATIVLAEAIAGSEPAFVDLMKEKVESWGIKDFELLNTTGLNNSYLNGHLYPGSSETDENSMTARGIATVATKLLQDYPEVLETSSISEKIFREGTEDAIHMKNWNWMLPGLIYERKNVDGLKTGTTDYAGASITGTAKEGDRRILTVVMGAGDGQTNKAQRFQETGKLLDYGFHSFETFDVLKEGELVKSIEAPDVSKGKEDKLQVSAETNGQVVAPKGTEMDKFAIEFKPDPDLLDENGAFKAPIKKGTKVGEFVVSYEGDTLGYLDGREDQIVSAVAAETVEKANVFSLSITWIKGVFTNLVNKVKK